MEYIKNGCLNKNTIKARFFMKHYNSIFTLHLEVTPLIWNLKTQNNGQILSEGGSGILSHNIGGVIGVEERPYLYRAIYEGPLIKNNKLW